MSQGYQTYQEISTMGMSQLDLILTVYRGAIGFLNKARSEFDREDLNAGRTACEKARKCIVHLYTTLDMDKGGEIAAQLGQLYAFMIQRIDLALASKSNQILEEVSGLLETIKEGWEGLKEQERNQASDPAYQDKDGSEDQKLNPAATASPGNRLTFSG